MKKLLFILILFSSCVIQKDLETDYLSLNEIKTIYSLSRQELRQIKKDANENKISHFFHNKREEWLYDDTIDYSIYRIEKR